MNKSTKTNLIKNLERKRDYLNEHCEYEKANFYNNLIKDLEKDIDN